MKHICYFTVYPGVSRDNSLHAQFSCVVCISVLIAAIPSNKPLNKRNSLYICGYVNAGNMMTCTCNLSSVRMAERLVLLTSDHGVVGSIPARGEILPDPKWRFIAQSLSCSPFHHPEILLKGCKTLTHPSINL